MWEIYIQILLCWKKLWAVLNLIPDGINAYVQNEE